jgi:protein-L-isoaspartate(D-aspartate) O-methyltransferase
VRDRLATPVTPATRKIRLILALRRAGITDTDLLSAFEHVPRGEFVPDAFSDQAFEDTALPIGHGQTVSQATVIARMIQALEPRHESKVLEVGTGSGYQTAILSHLFRRVYTIERERALSKAAQARLANLRRFNVTAVARDGSLGWPEQAPFDAIVVAASTVDIPPVLWEQLAMGGLMVIPIGENHDEQRLMQLRRTETGPEWKDLGPVRFVPLIAGRSKQRAAG